MNRVSIALCGVALVGVSAARGDAIDPNVPTVITVGPPAGDAPEARGDSTRSGRTDLELPSTPTELWRRNLSTIEMTPIVDARSAIIVVTASGDAVKLGADGKETWKIHVQGGGPTSSPTMLSDGTVGIITVGGTFTGLSPEGRVRFATSLGARGPDLVVPPVSSDDGGVVILTGRSMLTLDADGSVTTETPLPMRSSSPPLQTRDGWLVVSDDGSVYRLRPPKQAVRVGRFEAPVDSGAVLADERTLLAVMHDRLVALDLKTGLASTRASINSTSSINAPVTVGRDGSAFFTTSDGLFFAVDRAGQEELRATVERVAVLTPAQGYPPGSGYYPGAYPQYGQYGGYGYGYLRPDPPLVAGVGGRFAFVRSSGRFGIVEKVDVPAAQPGPLQKASPARVNVVTDHVCPTPIAVLPTGKRRLAVVCREGTIVEYAD